MVVFLLFIYTWLINFKEVQIQKYKKVYNHLVNK